MDEAAGSIKESLSILFVLPWNKKTGGVATVVGGLIRHLEKHGHRSQGLFPGPSRTLTETETDLGIRAFELDLKSPHGSRRPLKTAAAFWITCPHRLIQLARLLVREKVDVVNIHYPVEGFVYLAVLRWLIRFKLIISAHGSDLFPTGDRPRECGWTIRFLFRMADAVVTPSRAFGQEVVEIMPSASGKLRVIHNGLRLDCIRAGPPPSEGKDQSPEGSYVLSIGRQLEIKGYDTLIDAFAMLAPYHPELRLRLVGDGPERRNLVERVQRHGLSERVIFYESWDRTEIAVLLLRCRVFVVPSRREAFGLVNLEAMSCGKPVVATRVGGIPEVIEDGISGFLVPPDDPTSMALAIERLLEDAALSERLADSARRRVQTHFQSDRAGEQYENMFSELVGRTGV